MGLFDREYLSLFNAYRELLFLVYLFDKDVLKREAISQTLVAPWIGGLCISRKVDAMKYLDKLIVHWYNLIFFLGTLFS